MKKLCLAPFILGLIMASSLASAIETKLTCPEVSATEAKCHDYDAQTSACDALVQAEVKSRADAAKAAMDACKKSHKFDYVVKCKTEIKNAASSSAPKQIAGSPIQKELTAKADSPCARAEAIGKEAVICKGPKKVLETMKANCIKV